MRVLFVSAAFLAAAFAGACAGGAGEEMAAAPPPPAAAPMPEAPQAPSGSVAAPGVSVPPEAPPPQRDGDVTVPGGRELPPPGPADTRTNEERMAHIRAWDNCVMRLQNQAEDNPTRPALETPEEVCSRQLGMADRLSAPNSFRR